MTLEDIRNKWLANKLTAEDALQQVAEFMLNRRTQKQAEALINEIIGMPSEPEAMTAEQRKTALNWERNYRSE